MIIRKEELIKWWNSYVSVQFSRSVMSDSLWPHESQHARPPCPSPTSGACSNLCPSSRWCHPTISSSVIPNIFPKPMLPGYCSLLNLHSGWREAWRFTHEKNWTGDTYLHEYQRAEDDGNKHLKAKLNWNLCLLQFSPQIAGILPLSAWRGKSSL